MRKILPFLMALVPYLYFLGIGGIVLFDLDSDVILLGFFGLYFLLGIISAILYGSFANPGSNLWIKLAALPTDAVAIGFLIVRAIEISQAIETGAMGVGLSIFALLLFGFFYFLPRMASLIACAVACWKDSHIPPHHKILHLLPIADVISAALIFKHKQPI